tara:strand:+ start:256 stop:744 length:489 start_codon:yes stop_codon:yes gene_type:complete
MATYDHRRLFNQITRSPNDEGETNESVWAYYVKLQDSGNPIPGRFRIRVTRISNADFLQMVNPNADTDGLPMGTMISGQLDKWSESGWIPCLDWMGDPDSTASEIERELLSHFKMFTIGKSDSSIDWVPPPPPPKPKKPKVNPKVNTGDTPTDDDPDDLNWL